MEERIDILIAKKLTGEATNEELVELQDWAVQSEENGAALSEAEMMWRESDELFTQPQFNTAKGWAKVSAGMNTTAPVVKAPAKRVIFSPWIKTTIAAAAVLLVGFFIVNTFKDFGTTEILAANGDKEVVLPDNTVVTLYKGSSLSYNKSFDKELREVTLNGDAFFDVARNEEKAFIISAGEVDVKVLGTSFYTKSGANAYVAVVTGKVQMSKANGKAKLILTPGETGTLNNGSLIEELTDVNDLLYWKTGNINFEDIALEDLIIRLDKIFADEIRLSENMQQDTRKQMININFTKQTLQEMLEELCMVSKCSLQKTDNGYTIAQ